MRPHNGHGSGLGRQTGGAPPRLVLSRQDVLSIGEKGKKNKDRPISPHGRRKGIANRYAF